MRSTNNYSILVHTLLCAVTLLVTRQSLPAQDTSDQVLADLNQVQVLDGDPAIQDSPVWYYTDQAVDPEVLTAQLLDGADPARLPGWKTLRVPGVIQPTAGKAPHEIWYLKTFVASDYERPLSLRLGIIEDRDITYLNGEQIGAMGTMDATRAQAYDRIRIYDIPENLIRKNARNVLLVRVQKYFPYVIGIASDTINIGPALDIHRQLYFSQFTQLILLAIYFAVGSYFLFLFLRRRREWENLFFGLFVMTLVVYQFLRTQIKYELGFDFHSMKRIEYILLFFMPPLFYYFLRAYFVFPKTRFMRSFDIFMAVVTAIPMTGVVHNLIRDQAVHWDWYNQIIIQPGYIPLFVGILGVLIYQVSRRDRDALYILVGMLAMLGALILDILSTRHIINLPRMMGYAFMFFILNIAVVLANKFVRLHEEVEDLNVNLEKKVDKRTEQLNNSLNEIKALKEQQDGDYWLTSLLIKPLSGLFDRTPNVSIDLLERQKKQFSFRKWQSEIGGDINAVYSITLRDRKYTAFVNADAMGKSIQGAGGALVLGTVFKSVITRTEQASHQRKKYPEQWLKECFVEFQNIFVSFDGSMLMSAVMGLVDDATGLVYFINAEHPWVVLYRAGKAKFIEDEMLFRKLGTTGVQGHMQVRTFQMNPDDVLLLGSDGRDDILLGEREDGQRIINEDEQEFLRRVEEGGGILKEIEEGILKTGKLTDDFTLLRIGYREDAPYREDRVSDVFQGYLQAGRKAFHEGELEGAIEQYEAALGAHPDHRDALSELGQIYFKAKDYKQAADLLERYTDQNPGDGEYMYLVSFAYKQLKKLKRAADFGERFRLRNPGNIKNLVNLADIYRLQENTERAEMLLALALELDPEYKNAHRLQEALRKAG